MKKVILLGLCVGLIAFTGCKEDEDPIVTTPTPDSFTVTIENVFTGKDYFSAGGTGLIMPGSSESFSFQAGKGHYLQFATMFAQSNDLFYAPGDEGIALYDNAGSPLTGDITSMISFWDGGTEVNEEPGVGANQAPRQAGANTGDDENGNVQLLSAVNDGFMYPSVADVIEVTIAHDGGTMFTVTLNNVSGSASVPSPLAPGAWVVHSAGQKPLFTSGSAASTALERMAEDGDNAMLESSVVDN
ncbi:MAG: spondin domain-containing protein, partial [Bacteroidia bacterium]|nr:spondin domain-containing protein [Bacteroidia bacterium]